jgi:MPBQ/MSBQ methyltransferase
MNTIISNDLHQKILQYYVEAGLDYAFWSRGFNMHFGFGDLVTLFQREKMLNRMSEEVLRRLAPRNDSHFYDFGCGVGATMRKAIEFGSAINITGLTLVPWQKEKGDQLNQFNLSRLRILVKDYHDSSLPDNSADGVYAIESACYSPAEMHGLFFAEIHRVLKPGARLVIADGFLKKPESGLNPMAKGMYKRICENWALPGMMNISDVKTHLENHNFKNIRCEEISWKVAPSVLHVPFVILWFILYKTMKNEKLSNQSIRNLNGSFQALILGLHLRSFGYFLVSAEK